MSIRVSNLQEYYDQYIDAPQKAKTFKEKAKCFFDNQGLFKIMMVVGIALGLIGTMMCIIKGIPVLDTTTPIGILTVTGKLMSIFGLFLAYIHQSYLLERIEPHIAQVVQNQRKGHFSKNTSESH